MPNKTLYIRDDDEKIWQDAEEMVKAKKIDSLSKLVTDSIRKEVARLMELDSVKEGLSRIDVDLETDKGTRKIAFNGKWLVIDVETSRGHYISVALTEKKSYFVLFENAGAGNGEDDDYEVFDYFEGLTSSDHIPEEIKSMVASEVGEDYVEFLDI
jgi:hypothetical protein